MSIPNCKKPVESSKQVFYWDGKSNTDNTENIKLWQDIIDAAKLNESVTVIGVGSYGSYVFNVNKKKVEENSNLLSLGSISTSFYQREQAGGVTTDVITHGHVDIRFTDNKVSSNGGITESEYLANSYIPTNIRMPEGEITPYMPDKDWQPTTKKYVDDQVAGINVEIPNSNIVNGSVEGSLRTINSAAEDDTYTMGVSAFSVGNETKASGAGAFSSGNNTVASGNMSSAMGNFTEASEKYTHAEGIYTTATGEASHAEGYGRKFANQEVQRSTITASGKGSHAEGYTGMPNCFITASGRGSHAEGYTTNKEIIASGKGSHAENGVASGDFSHAENGSTASGNQSHAEGNNTTASGHNSHSEGWVTIASGENQHVQGKWNIEDTNNKYAHIVGNGNSTTNTTTRSNAHTIDWYGNAWFSGNVKVGGTGQDDTNAKELATKDFVNETIIDKVPDIFSWDGKSSTDNPDNLVLWQKIYDTAKEKTVMVYFAKSSYNGVFVFSPSSLPKNGQNKTYLSRVNTTNGGSSGGHSLFIRHINVNLSISSSTINSVSEVGQVLAEDKFLSLDNGNGAFTPTDSYHPATKKYVDDTIVDYVFTTEEKTLADMGIEWSNSSSASYTFSYNGTDTFTNTNQNQQGTTCKSILTFSKPFKGKIKWLVGSELNYDKFTLEIGTEKIADGISGNNITGEHECEIPQGTQITLTYAKDGSSDSNGDTVSVQFIGLTRTIKPEYIDSSSNSSNTSEFNSQYFVRDILLYADSQISDGKNLTTNYGITSEIFDKIKPGFVMYSEVGSNQKYYITPASVRWYRLIANSWYECIQVFYVYNGEFKSFNICKGNQAVWYGTDLSTYEPGAGGVACFTGDTLVYTDKGMKEISKIKKNDKVYSLNINNELELKPVDKLINHDVIGYYDVITDTDTFKASYSHPIYVEGKGAVKVINLQYGDMLKDCNGNLHMVKEVNAIEANTTVYEIRVKDNHNYFVGNDKIFVYNEESILD